ncbi:MAG: hypothetical protein GY786_04430 [Proteobacteria bacterium]|nr:hypothetical protein [Pseudomonadota bacterium]
MTEKSYHTALKPLYTVRLLARIFDLLVVTLIFKIIQKLLVNTEGSLLLFFLGYSLVCALFGEPTFGKQLLSLRIVSIDAEKLTIFSRISRELVFLLLLPFLVLNVIFGSDRAAHDRICNTSIISDGIRKS